MSLSHAAVVHHEEVDLQLVGAGAPDVVVLRTDEVDHLHTATLARGGRRHRALKLSSSISMRSWLLKSNDWRAVRQHE